MAELPEGIDSHTVPRPWETSAEVRDELASLLRRDLLGPWGGNFEVFEPREERTPRDRYITGLLAPADVDADEAVRGEASDDGDLGVSTSGDEPDDAATATNVQARRFFASSMGLTCAVPASLKGLRVTVTWGRYEEVAQGSLRDLIEESDAEPTDGDAIVMADGAPEPDGGSGGEPDKKWRRKKGWRRVPMERQVDIDVTVENGHEWLPDSQVTVTWVTRQRDGHRLVSVFVVNAQTAETFPKVGKDAPWMFQVELALTAVDESSPVFVSRSEVEPAAAVDESDAERQLLAMLYRRTPEFAVGHGTATVHDLAETPESKPARAWRVATDALPSHDVPQTVAPRPQDVPGLDGLVLDMKVLSSGTAEDAVAGLSPLVDAYRKFLADETARLGKEPDLAGFVNIGTEQVRLAGEAANRIEAGLTLLTTDPKAWQAFRFANEAMAMQRQHTVAVRNSRGQADLTWKDALTAADVPAERSWRPFQIAFVLLNLPALTDPGHADRAAANSVADKATADLLFFPTGGGKTEAYLGLTAYTFAIRRLQGVIGSGVGARDGRGGVAVLMRYTLRLLTAQQFQRAAALVCATEVLRRQSLTGEHTLGSEPFTLGLWVGGSVTPNSFTEAEKYVTAKKGHGRRSDAFSTSPVPLRECPWCGSPIDPGRDVSANPKTRRLVIYCGDTTGTCEFTERRNPNYGLPIVAVDEQIYREPTSLLIATVDKYAQLPWNGATSHLFGRVVARCERHGYKHQDMSATVCGADQHRAEPKLNLPAAKTVPVGLLRPPDLIIQDELHLISGALGTMVGLYETAVDELTTWTYKDGPVRAKVVASTATIRRADRQMHALFRRSLAVFPPPLLDVGDSFFARQIPVTEENPGRRYMGICAQGLRMKATEIRVTGAVMGMAQMLFDANAEVSPNPADPYMTLVAYFNALRELGGMRRLADDDVRARLANPNHAEMPVRYVNSVEELTSRVSSDRIPDTLQRLDATFGWEQTTQARAARGDIQEKRDAKSKKAQKEIAAAWPVDLLLATNMLATGVDVPRLGLMSVTGQPKSTAEYIQATSRVGRDPGRPGLVLAIYNWARPRDLSHFERFEHFHGAFYQQVEALSVTPFSVPALERGLTGAFMGALRNLGPEFNSETGLDRVDMAHPEVQVLIDGFAHRAAAVTSNQATDTEVRSLLEKRLKELVKQRALGEGTETLTYRSKGDGQRRVLRQPDSSSGWGMWTAPNSLRETEPDINLVLQPDDPSLESDDVPPWRAAQAAPSPVGDGS